MRIGIVTQPLLTNYGGILQNFALQEILRTLGHEPVTLRVDHYNWLIYLDVCLKVIVKKIIGEKAVFPENPCRRSIRSVGMENFISRNIVTTPKRLNYKLSDVTSLKLDALIVGSDQTWRPGYNRVIEDMFFQFAEKCNIIKLAYAASFGVDKWEYSPNQTLKCRNLVQSFKGISVREKSGIRLCREYLQVDAAWVLDPTLLVSRERYEGLCKDIPYSDVPFVFAYLLDYTDEKKQYVASVARHYNANVIYISAGNHVSAADTIERWIAMFRDACYVVTDSFHGTVFSIIFEREFVTFSNKKRGNSRFDSLFEITDLSNRLVEMDEYKYFSIDWKKVNERISHFRRESLEFLKNNLS